jgi:hypothetical protein
VIVRNDTGTVIGWVSEGGCENAHCLAAIYEGRPFHATPRGFAVTLPDYHFTTKAEAVAALKRAARENPAALRRAVEITERIREMS